MYCSQCGSKIEEGSAYCMTCGAPVIKKRGEDGGQTDNASFTGYDPYGQTDSFYSGTPVQEDRSFIVYLILSLITCGIYGIIFKYKLTEDVNTVCDGDGRHTMNYLLVILLSILTCGVYGYVWTYQIGDRIQNAAARRYGFQSSTSGVELLALTLIGLVSCGICSYIADYELITAVNALGEKYNAARR